MKLGVTLVSTYHWNWECVSIDLKGVIALCDHHSHGAMLQPQVTEKSKILS